MSHDNAPTHRLSRELQDKLSEAKQWHTEREELESQIRQSGGIAERNQEDRDISDRQGADILADIVEIIDRTWGFASPLEQRARRPVPDDARPALLARLAAEEPLARRADDA